MKRASAYLFTTAILLISILLSCNKEGGSPDEPIVHKWNIVRHVDTTVFFNGPLTSFDYRATNSDYLDFRGDGKLYRLERGVMDTLAFRISQDTLIVQDKYAPFTTIFKVEVITKDSLQLNGIAYVIFNSHDYRKTQYYLNRK